ncbi:glucosaminidase domain-containing protein [Aurantibacter crassamenti]|uniref:glucosaminidase domain-containing protein n=1 Tax=Aurantibacter crassamenti TaxID=1837375 RepID=UPI001939B449|nr:glucosaminidase domain-containing protein [Aurantibacter crassamenti]MBM1105912.1 glucosaminidase domain-containing protein [Aurantibacter crassamenti]
MIKKLMLLCILTMAVSSCKVKQRVTYADPSKKGPKVVVDKKKTTQNNSKDDGLYPLPEDSGKFQKFEIGSITEYIDEFAEIAQFEMKAFGIPASITLAQGLLESGFGKGELASKTNNHFGIKCHTGWQGDYDFHDDDEKGECFRKYNHPMYSYRDHSHFLTSRSRYAFLFDLTPYDYKKWAKGLSKAGYATDKKYPQKLISLIEKFQLYKYDNRVDVRNDVVVTTSGLNSADNIHTVQQGDTLYSIARRYAISVGDLKRLNKMNDTNLAIGQRLVVESK